jgi:3-phytase
LACLNFLNFMFSYLWLPMPLIILLNFLRMKRLQLIFVLFLAIGMNACVQQSGTKNTASGEDSQSGWLHELSADAETLAAPSSDSSNVPVDVAVWVNRSDPAKSLLVGTSMKGGLVVYDLKGNEIYRFEGIEPRDLDIRYDFPVGDKKLDIVGCSDPEAKGFNIFSIDSSGTLKRLSQQPIISALAEVTGFCLYHDKDRDMFYAFLTGKSGHGEQYRIYSTPSGNVTGELSRMFSLQSPTEGCVADDELGYFYIAEDNAGIWRCPASPDERVIRVLIAGVGTNNLEAPVKGLSIYYGADKKGYLIASSQGNNSFSVFERVHPNKYLGSFSIIKGEKAGGAIGTNGIAVCSQALGAAYPGGIFIAHDNGDKNYKMISWEKIAKSFNPALISGN